MKQVAIDYTGWYRRLEEATAMAQSLVTNLNSEAFISAQLVTRADPVGYMYVVIYSFYKPDEEKRNDV